MPKRSLPLHKVEDTPTSAARLRRTCCWPKCQKPTYEDVPLCGAHIEIAHDIQDRINQGHQALYRVQQVVVVDHRDDPAAPKAEPEPIAGTVYYVQIGPHIKIGWTSDMSKRMRAFPPNSQLLAQHPGTRKDEARMHRRFAADLTHGREWFVPSASLTRHIANVVTEHGQPDNVNFGAQPVKIPTPRGKSYVGGNRRGNGLIGEDRSMWA